MTAEEMRDLLICLIPYIEDIRKDSAYKPGAIAKLLREMRQAL